MTRRPTVSCNRLPQVRTVIAEMLARPRRKPLLGSPRGAFVLALFAVSGLMIASSRAAEERPRWVAGVGQNELLVLEVSAALAGRFDRVWTWSGSTAEGLRDEERRWFGNLDDVKPLGDGRQWLVCASNGGCALIDYPSGRVRWRAYARNAHSLDLLPRERALVASSLSGDELLLFDLATPLEPRWRTPLKSAHGVEWDSQRERVWVLGFDELRSYSLSAWDTTTPALTLDATYKLPDEDGHDLRQVPHSNDLVLSTGKHVWLFDRQTCAFRPHPQLADEAKIKSVDVHPQTGRTVVGRWTSQLQFLDPPGNAVHPTNRPYKLRWVELPAEKDRPAP